MPKYRIITQNDLDDRHPHRHPRAEAPEAQTETIVEAINPVSAIAEFEAMSSAPIAGRIRGEAVAARIVLIEEISVFDPTSITDEMIDEALLSAPGEPYAATMEKELYEDEDKPLLETDTPAFLSAVQEIADRLRESELVPGLNVSLLAAPEEPIDYAMVEVYEPAAARYLSTGSEIKHLVDDRTATGWDEIRSIARALIGHAAPLM